MAEIKNFSLLIFSTQELVTFTGIFWAPATKHTKDRSSRSTGLADILPTRRKPAGMLVFFASPDFKGYTPY